jgi:hypothetical protein
MKLSAKGTRRTENGLVSPGNRNVTVLSEKVVNHMTALGQCCSRFAVRSVRAAHTAAATGETQLIVEPLRVTRYLLTPRAIAVLDAGVLPFLLRDAVLLLLPSPPGVLAVFVARWLAVRA